MATRSATDLVLTLEQHRLLPAAQLEVVRTTLQAQLPEPRALARELVQRGWLTPFQVNHLIQGRVQELVLGPYLLLERLGQGGMGQVYKARHSVMNRVVALKVIRQEHLTDPEVVRRFEREIQAAAQLSHPNIVIAHDAAQVGETHFLVMEYIEGVDLARLVQQRGPLAVPLACHVIRQAALGLQHAHERGMVHRDIKPANLLVTSQGFQVKILDMGLARLTETSPENLRQGDLTQKGYLMGTPDYIAPEQALDMHSADIRSDIYSLGCTFYFVLTGQPPFPQGTVTQKIVWHQSNEPAPVVQFRGDLPAEIGAILEKMMAKKPARRQQTPGEVADALRPFSPSKSALQSLSAEPRGSTVKEAVNLQAMGPTPAGREPTVGPAIQAGRTPTASLSTPSELPARSLSLPRRPALLWIALAGGGGLLFLLLLVLGVAGFFLFGRGGKQPATAPAPMAEEKAPDKPGGSEAVVTNSVGMKLVRIPRGSFLMGSPASEVGRKDNEGPQHEVEITREFHMGAHEVTVGQFRRFVEDMGYKSDAETLGRGAWHRKAEGGAAEDPECNWRNPGFEQEADHPVVCVSWRDAVAFCDWLSRKESRVYGLPTEAEWEYACRAGTTTPFHYGSKLSSREANFVGAAPYGGAPVGPTLGRTARVGSYAPNGWGLYDMHGNAAEWCADVYSATYYRESPRQDPSGPAGREVFVVRGAAWPAGASNCRAAARFMSSHSVAYNDSGFRVILVAGGKK